MVLADTSVWIDFLRQGNYLLENLLSEGKVLTHELVIGELRVGNITKRKSFLGLLENLPRVGACSHEEVLFLIERHKLYGTGIGYMDAQLLCSAILYDIPLWTLDTKLANLAKVLSGRQ